MISRMPGVPLFVNVVQFANGFSLPRKQSATE
jgi:hypothetical protein